MNYVFIPLMIFSNGALIFVNEITAAPCFFLPPKKLKIFGREEKTRGSSYLIPPARLQSLP